jgi:two-component system OmpR family response regulator
MPAVIAIVEDEPVLAANYSDLLQRQGYDVLICESAKTARAQLFDAPPDLAILDVGLGAEPEAGFDLCRELRARYPSLPIIFLTARDDDIDIVSGLRLGADDFLNKGISNAQLLARITALLRRVTAMSSSPQLQDTIKRGNLTLDLNRLCVDWFGRRVDLTFTEFWMVHSLALHPGHLRNRQQLMDAAQLVLDDNTITSHIRRIRRKFEDVDPDFSAIETAYGVGYRWRADA